MKKLFKIKLYKVLLVTLLLLSSFSVIFAYWLHALHLDNMSEDANNSFVLGRGGVVNTNINLSAQLTSGQLVPVGQTANSAEGAVEKVDLYFNIRWQEMGSNLLNNVAAYMVVTIDQLWVNVYEQTYVEDPETKVLISMLVIDETRSTYLANKWLNLDMYASFYKADIEDDVINNTFYTKQVIHPNLSHSSPEYQNNDFEFVTTPGFVHQIYSGNEFYDEKQAQTVTNEGVNVMLRLTMPDNVSNPIEEMPLADYLDLAGGIITFRLLVSLHYIDANDYFNYVETILSLSEISGEVFIEQKERD